MQIWFEGDELLGAAAVVVTMVVAALVLVKRGWSHPFAPAAAIQLAFVCVLGVNVIGLNLNGPRATMALASMIVLMVAVPNPHLEQAFPHRVTPDRYRDRRWSTSW